MLEHLVLTEPEQLETASLSLHDLAFEVGDKTRGPGVGYDDVGSERAVRFEASAVALGPGPF